MILFADAAMAHARKEMRNGCYSILKFNKNWDPRTKTGKLAALVDLVTPSPVDDPDKFMGKLMEWKGKIVEANKSHQVVILLEIKTAILISMAPGEAKKELLKKLLFAEEDMTYEEAKGWAGRMIDEGIFKGSSKS